MNKKYLLCSIFLFLCFPFSVFATNDVSIVCNSTRLAIGEETTCSLVANNLNFTAVDVTGKVSVGSNLSIISSSYDNGVWMSLDQAFSVTDINLMRNATTHASSLTVATFRVKANNNIDGNSYIKFTNVAMGNSDYDSVSLNCNPVNFTFKSNVNTLNSLVITGKSINFSSDRTSYSIDVDEPSINVSAVATDPNSKISGIGTRNINYGKNIINVVVTSESGIARTYTINVNRKDNRSSNNYLKKLSLTNGKIKFDKNTDSYVIEVSSKVTEIDFVTETEDKKSRVEIVGNKTLVDGSNLFEIKVIAENESVRVYKVDVIREAEVLPPATAKDVNITVSGYDIKFNPNKYSYVIKTNDKQLSVKVTLPDSNSTYEIKDNENLKDGSIISIIIKDKENNTKTYKIIIENKEVLKESKGTLNTTLILLIISICINIILSITLILMYKNRKINN